jgi:hypothetical protein
MRLPAAVCCTGLQAVVPPEYPVWTLEGQLRSPFLPAIGVQAAVVHSRRRRRSRARAERQRGEYGDSRLKKRFHRNNSFASVSTINPSDLSPFT